jgi:epoxyqueuosine reductase
MAKSIAERRRRCFSARYSGSKVERRVSLEREVVVQAAEECGFELAGIAPAVPLAEFDHYERWLELGMAAGMSYLDGRRAELRRDARNLLPSARSVICVGKLYNTAEPYSTELEDLARGWISRYAGGRDYHEAMREGLERLAGRLRELVGFGFDYRVCVDTAPLLERSYARLAGLGWIAKNTCLINERLGSWLFLGELLTSLELEPDRPPPDRCGSCTRCIDACPTSAIVPAPSADGPQWVIDSRRCIAYFTIEHRGAIPPEARAGLGRHVFGCDICQDVCPWNRRAPTTADPSFAAGEVAPPLEGLAALSEAEFRDRYRSTPVWRTRYQGFLRNVAVAMGNSRLERFRAPLERLAACEDPVVAEHAAWALTQLCLE